MISKILSLILCVLFLIFYSAGEEYMLIKFKISNVKFSIQATELLIFAKLSQSQESCTNIEVRFLNQYNEITRQVYPTIKFDWFEKF
jgi:hypothetical protein